MQTQEDKKFVVKIAGNIYNFEQIRNETIALKAREKTGASVPKILTEGTIHIDQREVPYIIMEYIEPKNISKPMEEIFEDIGMNLGKMSEVRGE